MRTGPLRIVSANCGKGCSNTAGVLEWAIEQKAPVVLIQEPGLKGPNRDKIHRHPGYHVIAKPGKECRAAVYVAKTHQPSAPFPPEHHTAAAVVLGVTIISAYWSPYNQDAEPAVEFLAGVRTPDTCIIAGDFNAHHDTWDPARRPTDRGTRLEEMMYEKGLYLLNQDGAPTHKDGSVLDLAFGPDLAHARTRGWASDHKRMWIEAPAKRPHKPLKTTFLPPDEYGAVLDLFRSSLPEPPRCPRSVAELDALTDQVSDALSGAVAARSVPVGRKPKSAPWWNSTLAEARELDPKVYRRLLRQTRREFWRERVDRAKGDAALGRILRWKNDATDDRPTLIRVAGHPLTDPDDMAAALANAAFKPASGTGLAPYNHEGPTLPPDIGEWTLDPPTDEELKEAFTWCTVNTPGPDGVTLSLLKEGWDDLLPFLREITNGCLRLGAFPRAFKNALVCTLSKPGRDPHTYKGWRPITLLSVLGKGIERLLARRMTALALTAGLIPPDTAGAVPTRSAADLVTACVYDAEGAARLGWHSVLTLFDVDSAFPSVRVDKLGEVLAAQGWPAKLVALAQDFCSGRIAKFRWADRTFKTDSGLPQGSPWSPILWCLFTASLPKRDQGPAFSYADDVSNLTVGTDVVQVVWKASERAFDLHRRAEALGLKLDPAKTEALYVPPQGRGSRRRIRTDPLTIATPAGPVRTAKEVTWLGTHLDQKLSLKTHVTRRRPVAAKTTGLIRRINQVARGLPPESARKAVVAATIPTITYGLAALYPGTRKRGRRGGDVTTNIKGALEAVENVTSAALRAALPVWRTVPRPVPFWLAGIAPPEVVGREVARASARINSLPVGHPLERRLRNAPPRKWSRLHSLAGPGDRAPRMWVPRYPALRRWLAPAAPEPEKRRPGWVLPAEADPETYWEKHKPDSFAGITWQPRNPYLRLPRRRLARWVGEQTGHWDFHSYHHRMGHPDSAFSHCVCGEPREKNHFRRCLVTRLPDFGYAKLPRGGKRNKDGMLLSNFEWEATLRRAGITGLRIEEGRLVAESEYRRREREPSVASSEDALSELDYRRPEAAQTSTSVNRDGRRLVSTAAED